MLHLRFNLSSSGLKFRFLPGFFVGTALALCVGASSVFGAESLFTGMNALFNLTPETIQTTPGTSTVSGWTDALGGTLVFSTPTGKTSANSGSMTFGAKTVSAVDFPAGAVLVGSSSQNVQTVFLVTHMDVSPGIGSVFGNYATDWGIRVQSGTLSLTNVNQDDFWVGAQNAKGVLPYVDGAQTAKSLVGANRLVSEVRASDSRISGAFQPALGHYAANLGSTWAGRTFDGQMAEIVAFDWRMTTEEIKIVNSLLAAKFGMTDVSGLYAIDSDYASGLSYLGKAGSLNVTSADSQNLNVRLTSGSFANENGLAIGASGDEIIRWSSDFTEAELKAWTREWAVSALDSTWVTGDDAMLTLTFDAENPDQAGTLLLFRNSKTADYSVLSDALTVNGSLISFTLPAALFRNGGYVTLGTLPEPSAWLLLIPGIFGILAVRRKNRQDGETNGVRE